MVPIDGDSALSIERFRERVRRVFGLKEPAQVELLVEGTIHHDDGFRTIQFDDDFQDHLNSLCTPYFIVQPEDLFDLQRELGREEVLNALDYHELSERFVRLFPIRFIASVFFFKKSNRLEAHAVLVSIERACNTMGCKNAHRAPKFLEYCTKKNYNNIETEVNEVSQGLSSDLPILAHRLSFDLVLIKKVSQALHGREDRSELVKYICASGDSLVAQTLSSPSLTADKIAEAFAPRSFSLPEKFQRVLAGDRDASRNISLVIGSTPDPSAFLAVIDSSPFSFDTVASVRVATTLCFHMSQRGRFDLDLFKKAFPAFLDHGNKLGHLVDDPFFLDHPELISKFPDILKDEKCSKILVTQEEVLKALKTYIQIGGSKEVIEWPRLVFSAIFRNHSLSDFRPILDSITPKTFVDVYLGAKPEDLIQFFQRNPSKPLVTLISSVISKDGTYFRSNFAILLAQGLTEEQLTHRLEGILEYWGSYDRTPLKKALSGVKFDIDQLDLD